MTETENILKKKLNAWKRLALANRERFIAACRDTVDLGANYEACAALKQLHALGEVTE